MILFGEGYNDQSAPLNSKSPQLLPKKIDPESESETAQF